MGRSIAWILIATTLLAHLLAQLPFRQYRSYEEADQIPVPAGVAPKADWTFARLMYPENPAGLVVTGRDWRQGGTSWSQDYPRADRHFAAAVQRLTRVDARAFEQPVNLDDGEDVFNWPFLVVGETGDWILTDSQVGRLREYLERGGFLLVDDLWGEAEWGRFWATMGRVFPGRPVEAIEDQSPLFHGVYQLDSRIQVFGEGPLAVQQQIRSKDSPQAWLQIQNGHGQTIVAITFNQDIGDSWEWADDPTYPERSADQGIRWGINAVIYSLTH